MPIPKYQTKAVLLSSVLVYISTLGYPSTPVNIASTSKFSG